MKKIIQIFSLIAFGAIVGLVSCEEEHTISNTKPNYEAGEIPGLGNTPGDLTGSPFTLPTGVELTGDITGGGHSSNYWTQGAGNYYGSGVGYVDLQLNLRNVRSTSVTITFPAATILISKAGHSQNGVLIQKVTVTIPANSEYKLYLSFYCGNEHKGAATSGSIYSFGVVSNAKPLIDLCNMLQNKKVNIERFSRTSSHSIYTEQVSRLQSIVWLVTDGNGLSQNDIEYINSLPNN